MDDLNNSILSDFGISSDGDDFNFMNLLMNVRAEIIILSLIVIFLMLSDSKVTIYKHDLLHMELYFGRKTRFTLLIIHAAAIALIPLINDSPITVIVPIGLISSLFISSF